MTRQGKMSIKGAPPSYQDLGQTKPQSKNPRAYNHKQPVRWVYCEICKSGLGTLINKDGKYYHQTCQQ